MEWEDIDRNARQELLRMVEEVADENVVENCSEKMWPMEELEDAWRRREKYDYQKAFGRIRKARNRKIGWRIGAVACMVGVILGSFWFLGERVESVDFPLGIETRGNSEQVVLKMSDGKQVVLGGRDSLRLQEDKWGIQVNKGKVDYSIEQQGERSDELKYNELSIPVGGEYQIVLADGTCVHLNAKSKLKFPVTFSGTIREVHLEGEAFFDVAKDVEHPFVVRVGSMSVKVLGTRFNVNAYRADGVYETTLVEGKVEVSDRSMGQRVTLYPDQQARLKDGQLSIREVDVSLYTSWVNGKFHFEKETLLEITAQLERWYGVHFCFTNENLKREMFTGVVRKNYTIEQILSIIEKTTNVKFSVEGQTVMVN
jgi:sigma factor regulatory protein, fecR/pupR family